MVKKETKEEKIRFNTNNIQKPEILKGFQINNLKDINTYIDEMEIKILSKKGNNYRLVSFNPTISKSIRSSKKERIK